ncbi:MAG: prolyl oligopeptidase family serine peptidase [Candidatus Caldipriscus sp.]
MITELYVLGPFLAGVREPFVDFLYPKSEEYYSVFSAEPLRWKPLKFFGDSFRVEWDASEIKKLSEYQGVSASLAVYYVKGKIRADSGIYLVRFTNVLWVEINGKRYIMDIYNDGLFVPVPLKDENELFMAVSALGGERTVKFEIKRAIQEPYIVENDITKPDLIVGENFVGYVGIPVANPTKDGVWITLNNRKYFLEGFQVLKVPVLISIKAPNSKGRVVIPINFMGKRYEIPLEVKGEDEVIRRTFISGMDSSVQYYAVRYPRGYNPNRKYALILSLHGAGVEAFNQCRSYKQKDWAFVVCPTNRRRFGFDWEDFGRVDALEVLSEALKNYPIDRNKIYLTGHSMGGHGTWHLCTSYPSIWTACLPMAGWTSVKFYLSTHLQRAKLFPESEFTHLRERIFQQSEPYKLVENLLNLPVVVLHGGDDEVVPPFHSRLMADIMSRYGVKFKYIEVPKKGHWWDGVLDHEEAWRALLSLKVNRKEKVFVTFSLDVSDSAFGVRILEVERPFEKAKFTINYDKGANIKTENIKALVLTNFRGDVIIDGTRIRNYKGEILVKGRVWEKVERYNYSRPVLIRETFYSPFLIVYSSSELWTKDFAVYMANMWWMYANGKAQVIPDTMLNYFSGNYNLVIIGSKLKLPAQIADEFLKVEENSVSVRKIGRLLLFYKISDEGLIRLAMSMVPYITRSVAVMPSYIKLSYDAYLMGWSGLKGGILSFPPR